MGRALRGHRDSGKVQVDVTNYDEGNFRAVLQLMVDCEDAQVEEHIRNARLQLPYMSPQTQNQLINACFRVLHKEIV